MPLLKSSFRPSTGIQDLSGKVFFITGGNAGLGFETIKQLGDHHPGRIYLASRDHGKGEAAIQELKKLYPSLEVENVTLDLTSFDSITSAAHEFVEREKRLDCLINNAGIMAVPAGETAEGYEIQFGTNHMGHALLTRLLLPTLQATTKEHGGDVRIINLTSEGHKFARTGTTLLNDKELKLLGPWPRYGYSKLANILFTHEMANRYPEITSVAIHPGIVSTGLYEPNQKSNPIMRYAMMFGGWLRASVETGALNQLWAATCEKDQLKSGAYYKPVGIQSSGSELAHDAELARQLWNWTEQELDARGIQKP